MIVCERHAGGGLNLRESGRLRSGWGAAQRDAPRNHLGQLAEVLGDSCQEELFFSPGGTAQGGVPQ